MSDNITLVLKSHNQEIALREVVRICLGTTISVSETAPDKNFVISKADFSGDFISVETEINYNGKSGKNTYEHKIDCEKTENQNMTNAVKTGFYKLFCELFEKTLPWGSQTGIRPALLAQRRLNLGHPPEECIKSLMEEYSISYCRTIGGTSHQTLLHRPHRLSTGKRFSLLILPSELLS